MLNIADDLAGPLATLSRSAAHLCGSDTYLLSPLRQAKRLGLRQPGLSVRSN